MILLPTEEADEKVVFEPEIEIFGRGVTVSDIRGYSSSKRFGMLYSLHIRTFSGKTMNFSFVGIGSKARKVECDIDTAIENIISRCRDYWTAKVQRDLFDVGAFSHEGFTLKRSGEVSDGTKLIRICSGRLTHEVHGDKVVLRHTIKAKTETLEWSPGIAMRPIIDQIYYIREQLSKLKASRDKGGQNPLKLKATGRMLDVLAHLAAVIVNPRKPTDYQRLSIYLASKGARMPTDAFLNVAPNFIRSKGYLQKAFESLYRYHEKNGQQLKARDVFFELADLALEGDEYSPRQLFALYEIGLFLGFSLPRITAVLSAIKDKKDPNNVEESNTSSASSEFCSSDKAFGAETELGSQGNDGASHRPIRFPSALSPMLAILKIREVHDGEELKQAWRAAVKEAHPDTLGLDASEADREAATLATKDINMAYDLLKPFVGT